MLRKYDFEPFSKQIILIRQRVNKKGYEKKVKTIAPIIEAEGVNIPKSCAACSRS